MTTAAVPGPGPAAPPDTRPARVRPVELRTRDLVLGYDDRVVVDGVTVAIPPGQITMICGANGSGKSTLLRGLARLLAPRAGTVLLDDHDVHRMPTRDVARRLGLLPQSPIAPEGITVADLIARGRAPHQRWWQQWSARDEDAVLDAMAATGTTELADRPVDELSGGQRQRVWLAMALAQETELLLLDEPTTYLDISHQVQALSLICELNTTRQRTVVMVLHELNHSRWADHVIAMKDGQVVAEGPPEQVITAEVVRDVFDLACVVVPCPVTGRPLVVPTGQPA